MKHRILHTFTALLLSLVLLYALVPQRAEAASASLSGGSGTIQPGNSVTLTLSVSGSDFYGFSGTLNYGSNMSFTNYSCSVSGWSMEVNGTNFSAYGTNSASGGAVLTVTLKVDSSAKSGDALAVGFTNIVVSDGERDISISNASWSGSVAAAPSANCDLSAIICTNATLSPAFNKNTTYYTTTVPYSVEKLTLDYNRADSGQSVNISGNSGFVVGENTVTLTVKAANGATKTYTIVVTREQDPNYKPSTDATLSELTLDGATLSPTFRPGVTEYIAYVPHEVRQVVLSGVAHDEKALSVTESKATLTSDGESAISITCTAEDGVTKQTYHVRVYRMPAYTGGSPLIEYTNEKDIEPPEEVIPSYQIPMNTTLPLVGEVSTLFACTIAAAVLVILLFLLGLLIGRSMRSKQREFSEAEPEREIPNYSEVTAEPASESVPLVKTEPVEFEPENTAEPENAVERQVPETPAPLSEEDVDDQISRMSLDDLLKDIHDM